MSTNAKPSTDAYTFSLRGVSTINSFVVAPAIADDRINKMLDDRLKQARTDQPDYSADTPPVWGRLWLHLRRRLA